MIVNNAKKTLNPYAEKGKKGIKKGNPGRPKGAKDKIARTAKQNIEKVVEELGGWKAILKWAQKNQRNEGLVYGWYFKMLPSNVTIDGDLNVVYQVSEKFLPKTGNENAKK